MPNTWSRDELIIAFNLYCRIPFGRLHRNNPQIIEMSERIGRSSSALAMKLGNFASFDPIHKKRNVRGLGHAAKGDRDVWEEFNSDWERLAFESQSAIERLIGGRELESQIAERPAPNGPTDMERIVRVRLVQSFFREAVLSSYKYSCSICGLPLADMLCASHIIPWSKNTLRRADPTNGISLCSFHDRAFDRGLISIEKDFSVIVSGEIRTGSPTELHQVGLLKIEGRKICLPEKFVPDAIALEWHREHVFRN